MTQEQLFDLFCKYDCMRADALSKRDLYDRTEALDEALLGLLHELAQAAKIEVA